jgi:hypothetical protein
MDLPTTLLGWLLLVLAIVASVGIAFAARFIVIYITSRLQSAAVDKLRKWALTSVRALMQSPDLEGLANEEKKERAMFWLANLAASLNINVTAHELSLMIEEAVWLVKNVTLPTVEDALS